MIPIHPLCLPIIRYCFISLSGMACLCELQSCSGTLQDQNPKVTESNPNGRNDDWGFVGYGGGGAMFYPAVSPHDPNYAMVACDMTGSFVTLNGGESWRMFNLRGPVKYFVFDPGDSNTVYAKSIALYKSTDKGNTWRIFYPQPADVTGVISKGDHASEVIVTKDSTKREVLALAVDPVNSKKLYAVIAIDEVNGFYFSEDGGAHWLRNYDLSVKAQNIFIDPSSPESNRTIYITSKKGVIRKENGQWKTYQGPQGVKQLTEFSGGYDQKNNKYVLYAISGNSYFNPQAEQSGIYYSEDGGETWENRQRGILDFAVQGAQIPEWRSIATSALHPAVVYVSYNNLKVHNDTTCIGVARSVDYGKTWELSWKDRLTAGGNFPSRNFISGWINKRFGPTWGENPFSIGVSPNDPNVCYGTDFGRTIKTVNGGKTWEQVYTKEKPGGGSVSRGLEVTTGYTVVFDPFNSGHVFIANTDIGLMESHDGAVSWSSATLNNGVPREWLNSTYWLEFDPEVKGRAWAAMSGTHDLPRPKMFRKNGVTKYKGGILVTEDAGKTWKPVSADIGDAAMTHVLIDRKSDVPSRTLYACAFGKGVYKSVDGGKTWKEKNNGIEGDEPFAWRIVNRERDGVLFLIVNRRSEDGSIGNKEDGALYRSEDGGDHWKKMSLPEETNGPMTLAVDPENVNHLLLGAWGRQIDENFSPDIGGGIFRSKDEGKTWVQVMEKDQHIHDITFDPRNNRYYACGFNGSAYWSEDGGENWNRIKGYNFKWGKRVDFDPINPEKIFIITFGGGVWYGPAKGDQHAVEDIIPLVE